MENKVDLNMVDGTLVTIESLDPLDTFVVAADGHFCIYIRDVLGSVTYNSTSNALVLDLTLGKAHDNYAKTTPVRKLDTTLMNQN